MIKADFGSIIATKRKECKLSQPQLAALMCKKGLNVKAHSISKWEKNVNLPNVLQFFALCEILKISDINQTFQVGTEATLLSKLNKEGHDKALDYINLLFKSGMYLRKESDHVLPAVPGLFPHEWKEHSDVSPFPLWNKGHTQHHTGQSSHF